VTASENLEAIRKALAIAGNPKSRVVLLTGINHNLQTSRTGKPSEYFQIEETVGRPVLNQLSTWLGSVAGQSEIRIVESD